MEREFKTSFHCKYWNFFCIKMHRFFLHTKYLFYCPTMSAVLLSEDKNKLQVTTTSLLFVLITLGQLPKIKNRQLLYRWFCNVSSWNLTATSLTLSKGTRAVFKGFSLLFIDHFKVPNLQLQRVENLMPISPNTFEFKFLYQNNFSRTFSNLEPVT